MKLARARITKYKSVVDSDWFTLEQITCLVGKNESGKTAILEALEKLNAARGERANLAETDFPRVLSDAYSEDEVAVEAVGTLDENELEELRRLAGDPAAVKGREVAVQKNYANELKWTMPFDWMAATQALLASGSLSKEDAAPLESGCSDRGAARRS